MAAISVRQLVSLLLGSLLAAQYCAFASGHHFVLVHGFGYGAWCWYKVTTLLEEAGNTVTPIDLASNGINKAIADNITTVAQYTKPLNDFLATNVTGAAQKVILVAHSLGGSSISYAMELFPQKISKAVFLAAYMPSNNESFVQPEVQPNLASLIQARALILNYANALSTQPTSASINLTLARPYLFNKSPLEDAYLAYALLNPTPYAITTETLNLTSSNYGSITRYYIKTSIYDHALPQTVQDNIISNNPPYQVSTLDNTDHSPFFSQPLALVSMLMNDIAPQQELAIMQEADECY